MHTAVADNPHVLEPQVHRLSDAVGRLAANVGRLERQRRCEDGSTRRTQLALAIQDLKMRLLQDASSALGVDAEERAVRLDYIKSLQRELDFLYE